MIKPRQHKQQQGVALVVSLIILVSLTMLGLTSIQRTTTDLSMAGNQRETGLMFQAAEMALDAAEDYIDVSTSTTDFNDPDDGMITVIAGDTDHESPDYFDKTMWKTRSTPTASAMATELGLDEQPRFMIEYLGDRAQNALAKINIGGYGSQLPGDIVSIFRSTAQGAGVTGNSFRYVQSYYGKKIN